MVFFYNDSSYNGPFILVGLNYKKWAEHSALNVDVYTKVYK
jgi:hypothetical protein